MTYSILNGIIACTLLVMTSVNAQNVDSFFQEGNRLYQEENYLGSIDLYNAILETGVENGELHYNIGNAYYKLNTIGKAMLHYERARRYIPDNEDLLHNIELTTLMLTDKITPLSDVFYVRFWNAFRGMLGVAGWKMVFFIAWYFAAAQGMLVLFLRQHQARGLLKTGLMLSAIVIVVAATVFLSNSIVDKPGTDGVVMIQETSAYSAPIENGTQVFMIHEGTKVHITRSLGEWVEIRLADGNVGWIRKNSIDII